MRKPSKIAFPLDVGCKRQGIKLKFELINASPRFAKSVKLWVLFKRILSVWKSTSLQSGVCVVGR